MIGWRSSIVIGILLLYSFFPHAESKEFDWVGISRPHVESLEVEFSFEEELVQSLGSKKARTLANRFKSSRFFGTKLDEENSRKLRKAIRRSRIPEIQVARNSFYLVSGVLQIQHDMSLSEVIEYIESVRKFRSFKNRTRISGIPIQYGDVRVPDPDVIFQCDSRLSFQDCLFVLELLQAWPSRLKIFVPKNTQGLRPHSLKVVLHPGKKTEWFFNDTLRLSLRHLEALAKGGIQVMVPETTCVIGLAGSSNYPE